jgi:hypothetical protein
VYLNNFKIFCGSRIPLRSGQVMSNFGASGPNLCLLGQLVPQPSSSIRRPFIWLQCVKDMCSQHTQLPCTPCPLARVHTPQPAMMKLWLGGHRRNRDYLLPSEPSKQSYHHHSHISPHRAVLKFLMQLLQNLGGRRSMAPSS